MPGQPATEYVGVVEQCCYWRLWPQVTDGGKRPFGAAHNQQVIVHEHRSRLAISRRSDDPQRTITT